MTAVRIGIGLLVGLLLGGACRLVGIPVPAPPDLLGAALVVSITLGYVAADLYLERRER